MRLRKFTLSGTGIPAVTGTGSVRLPKPALAAGGRRLVTWQWRAPDRLDRTGGTMAPGAPPPAPGVPLWMSTGEMIHQYYVQNPPVAAQLLNRTSTMSTSQKPLVNPNQDGFTCTPVLDYFSFAQFQADVGASAIGAFYGWVLYDLEQSVSPLGETQDPVQYLRRFAQFGHDNGYQVAVAPGLSLGNTATVNPKNPGEPNGVWYIRVGIAAVCGQYSDLVVIQSQSDETSIPAYQTLVGGALTQIRGAGTALAFQEVSTGQGAASDMIAAVASEPSCDGVYVNLTEPAITIADTFYQSFA